MKKASAGNVEVQYYIPDQPPNEKSPLLNTKSMGGSVYWPRDKGRSVRDLMELICKCRSRCTTLYRKADRRITRHVVVMWRHGIF